MSHWRLLYSDPLSGAENMATDMALMDRAKETGETVFRVYSWAQPTLSLGRNQTAKGRYRTGILDIVRRPTGGRALFHHREITYSVTGPADGSLRSIYDRINRVLLGGLRTLGVPAQLAAARGRSPLPTDAPCFEAPTGGELVVDGRKLAGSAQWQSEGAFLQHGSILIDNDQGRIADLMVEPPGLFPEPATLRSILGRAPAPASVSEAMFQSVRKLEDREAAPLAAEEVRHHADRWLPHFQSDEWTWRR